MSSYSTKYRKEHPESYKKQQEAKKIKYENDENYREQQLKKKKERYDNDPEYKERKKAAALARYYRLKEAKASKPN